ncbi:MAG: NAD(P)H-dependent oxidoreductase [Treponema sp.]|nr:NAD(P)H-dependent oxidoreductase [Treponema sp.]
MADTLIIYYSLEGNVDFLARDLAKKLNADLFRIETVKNYPKKGLFKFLHGGKDAISGFKPELKTTLPDISLYKSIVIGTPVWAGNPAAPINTVLDELDFSGKKVAAFASSAGGDAVKTLEIISSKVRNAEVSLTESFKNPLKNIDEAMEKLDAFAKKI